MDDALGLWTGRTKGVNMGHDIVLPLPLLFRRHSKVDGVDVPFQLLDHLLRDGLPIHVDAERPLRLGQPDPESAPSGKLLLLREVELHLSGGVAGVEGGLVPTADVIGIRFRHGEKFDQEWSLERQLIN